MVEEAFGNRMIGIIQGRLTDSNGRLQCFPDEKWKEEFGVAKRLGFDYIELISDPDPNDKNPLWSGDTRPLKESIENTGLVAYSVCIDHIMHKPLTHPDSGVAEKSKRNLFSILKNSSDVGVKVAVLPFLEGSSLKDGLLENGIAVLKEVGDYANNLGIKIALECDLSAEDQIEIVEACPNIFLCYDTGNRTYFGFNPKEEIQRLGKYIIHVHIKDKILDGKNVMLGSGVVNFEEAFQSFKLINYNGNFTLETSRGSEETKAASENLSFIKKLISR